MQGELFPNPRQHVEEIQVTTFIDEGEMQKNAVTDITSDHNIGANVEDHLTNGLLDILQRPLELFTKTWTANDAATTELARIPLPGTYLTKSMIARKIADFRFIKMKLHVRVQVNAQPFCQGRLLIIFDPMRGQLNHRPSSMNSLSGLTGYPHVEIDLAEATAAEIEVPYIPVLSHIDLIR